MERHIFREGTSSCPILFSGSQGMPTLAPPCKPYRQRGPKCLWSAACPSLDSQFSVLCLNLTAWLSRGLLPVTQLFDSTTMTRCHPPPFTNHNLTACQSTRGHCEPTENPCHMLYMISLYPIFQNVHKLTSCLSPSSLNISLKTKKLLEQQ